ncbi:MAG: Periplasmic divalent cation tolerance protein CutA [uncultured Chthoniobacterales bacterium]|uniref:Periplasmic divalent cation tolerance protein CutA n=1 Tax=uncultured Chthoniobacterales bacterium TaxID=1836801 RepID=A0A6J4I9L7_9BACT|nr:MAG: Periplasmic divalent cation tolerance protein CutA [uncultured Chthoniobacterales bacterium]
MAEEILLAMSTFPDAQIARSVSRQLVEQKLAACANIGGCVESIYHWQGQIEEAQETLVLFKTTRSRFEEFQRVLRSLHPYEVPEIVALRIADGFPGYLQWVESSCA